MPIVDAYGNFLGYPAEGNPDYKDWNDRCERHHLCNCFCITSVWLSLSLRRSPMMLLLVFRDDAGSIMALTWRALPQRRVTTPLA